MTPTIDPAERAAKAETYFRQGYNCTQSVTLAFEDILGIDRETLLKLSSSFGGGVGRMREICGCVSGMAIVLGTLYGYSSPEDREAKKDHYALIQKAAHIFEDTYGSIVCKELLGLEKRENSPVPDKRTDEYYKKRPCAETVAKSAEITAMLISEKNG